MSYVRPTRVELSYPMRHCLKFYLEVIKVDITSIRRTCKDQVLLTNFRKIYAVRDG